MARFRGIVRGGRGEASRLGHSALSALAESWQGGVSVYLYTEGGTDYALVQLVPHHGAGTHRTLYNGPVSGAAVDLAPLGEARDALHAEMDAAEAADRTAARVVGGAL